MGSKPAVATETRQTATAYLCVKNAAAAIEFYKKVFGATEIVRLADPAGELATPRFASAIRPFIFRTSTLNTAWLGRKLLAVLR